MITAYHRPRTIQEAVQLVSRPSPRTVPLGGGTVLVHHRGEPIEVVDLQALGLNHISKRGNSLVLGATVTLQQLAEAAEVPASMKRALSLEATLNLRNSASLAGTLMACDGRSSFVTVLLAMDARVTLMRPHEDSMGVGELLPLRDQYTRATIITSLEVPLKIKSEFDYVARTPADSPIVCVAVAQWPSGRTRLALGGYGASPMLGMDGGDVGGLETAASNAFHEASDPWGSADYRKSVAATLARRCMERLSQ